MESLKLNHDINRSYQDVSQAIGQVPMVKLQRLHPIVTKQNALLKLESCNPTGSIKDKNAAYLINLAESRGLLTPGGTIVESSSGNFGIGLAAIGAARGYKVTIVVDSKTSSTMKRLLKAYGARLEEVPLSMADKNGSMQKARMNHAKSIASRIRGSYYPCQHLNPDNPSAHFLYTGKEILQGIHGELDAVVVGISTAGQITGLARYLRIYSPKTSIIAVDVAGSVALGAPAHPYKMTGLGLSFTPPNLDTDLITAGYTISDQLAFSMCHLMAQKEGMLLGASTGAIVAGGIAYMQTQPPGRTVLMINPDRGDRYLDTVYNDQWLEKHDIRILNETSVREEISKLSMIPDLKGEIV